MKNKKYRSIKWQLSAKLGFSFVELIIVIAVIALISVIWMSINNNYTEKTKNSKISSDIKTIQNSLESYKNETKTLPLPKWNQKYFDDSSNYVHYDDTTAFWVYGNITEDTIPKKYMNYTPIDPRTNQYYAYGKTLNWDLAFEISWVNKDNNIFESVVIWDYVWENWPYNLIREYNWPDFVYDQSKNNFPYNPEERVIKAKLWSFSWEVLVNNKPINKNWIDNNDLVSWDEIFVWTGWQVEIFYSDWSKSYLWDPNTTSMNKTSRLVLANMTYKWENNLLTKIQLALDYGSIWTKTSRLDSDSEFEIYTTDTEAAVRGTVFGVEKEWWMWWMPTYVTIVKGTINISKFNWIRSITDLVNWIKANNLMYSPFPTPFDMNTVWSIPVKFSSNTNSTGTVLPWSIPSLPNEDWLENIKPKITSINSGKVTLEFPTSFSGTSNGKKVYTWSTAIPSPSPHYTFSWNTLTLLWTIAWDVYTLKICDSQGIKCTQEISINKDLAYNGTVWWCNPPYQIQFTWPEYTWCIDMDQSLVNSWYTLVAYAPLDWNANLYYHTWSFVTFNLGNISSSPYTNLWWTNYALNLTWPNELQYTTSWLGIWSSPYAIEMSVKWESLTWVTSTWYLFKDSNPNYHYLMFKPTSFNLILWFYNWFYNNSKYILSTDLSSFISINWMSYYKIISILDWTNWNLKLIDSSNNNAIVSWPGVWESTNFPSTLFIWQDFTWSLDYVKIYKK